MPHYIIYYTSYAEVDASSEEDALCIDTDNQIMQNIEVADVQQDD